MCKGKMAGSPWDRACEETCTPGSVMQWLDLAGIFDLNACTGCWSMQQQPGNLLLADIFVGCQIMQWNPPAESYSRANEIQVCKGQG
jgi:hypothetical protein